MTKSKYNKVVYLLWMFFLISCHSDRVNKRSTFKEISGTNGVKIGYFDKRNMLFLLDRSDVILDSVVCKPTENQDCFPTILIKDINNDGIYDLVIQVDYSDENSLISYFIMCSGKDSLLAVPKLKLKNGDEDFFRSSGFVNYNMRILSNNILMFQHKYSSASFYKIEGTDINPIVEVSRGADKFNKISYWNASRQSWDEPAAIMNTEDTTWLRLADSNWERPFIGGE